MAMSAGLLFSRREHTSEGTDVIELDTKAAAPADHVTPVNVQRQFAQVLPSKVRKNSRHVPLPRQAAMVYLCRLLESLVQRAIRSRVS